MSEQQVKPGLWRHYKGGMYEVLFSATHTETGETMVIYRALYDDDKTLARPASMWFDQVDEIGTKRFVFVDTNDTEANHVRSMNDEELAKTFAEIADCVVCETMMNANCRAHHGGFSCQDCWLYWLKQTRQKGE